jgi:hypothetical protein
MRLALAVLEGQNFARKNHHRIGPRCAGASELASVDGRPAAEESSPEPGAKTADRSR